MCDLGMPGMDDGAARRLRQEPGRENVLLAAVSGSGQKGERRRSKKAGVDRHLIKSIG